MALVFLVLGAGLTVAGAALLSWKVGLVVAGVLLLAAGIDMGRDTRVRRQPETP